MLNESAIEIQMHLFYMYVLLSMILILRIKLKKLKYKMVIKFIETITINSFCENYWKTV